MPGVSEDEVLLLWRALIAFRSGRRPGCAATGTPPQSRCPLYGQCSRWGGPEDYYAVMDETPEETERRRASWPCTRVAGLLSPELRRMG